MAMEQQIYAIQRWKYNCNLDYWMNTVWHYRAKLEIKVPYNPQKNIFKITNLKNKC